MATETVARRKVKAWQMELSKLYKRHRQRLSPEVVVQFAQDPTTALHECFEWDDTKAANGYRRWQARELIAAVVVVNAKTNKGYRVYVSLEDDRQDDAGSYYKLVDVLSDGEKRKRYLEQALAEFDRWKERYESLKELVAIFEARGQIA